MLNRVEGLVDRVQRVDSCTGGRRAAVQGVGGVAVQGVGGAAVQRVGGAAVQGVGGAAVHESVWGVRGGGCSC